MSCTLHSRALLCTVAVNLESAGAWNCMHERLSAIAALVLLVCVGSALKGTAPFSGILQPMIAAAARLAQARKIHSPQG